MAAQITESVPEPRPERSCRVTAHPQRLVRRCGGVACRDDAVVVDAGERLVGEQPAECVGAEPAGRASSGTPKPAVQMVSALHGTTPSARTTASGRTSLTASPSSTVTPCRDSHLVTDRRPGALNVGARGPLHTSVTLRPYPASSAAVLMPVNPPPTTVTGASPGNSSSTARSRRAGSNSAMGKANSAAPGTDDGTAPVLPTA